MPRKGREQATATTAAGSTGNSSQVQDGPLGYITVTAQQSRFHNDAVDAPVSKEVLIKDLSISVGQREILSHAEMHLYEGRHYVLVGRNGTGKSTLMKAIANGLIPGIPWSLRVLLLGQTAAADELDQLLKLKLEDETVLQHVVKSDRVRERYLREAKVLSEAIDQTKNPMAPIEAFRQISHERLGRCVAEAAQIATRRSGARGSKARKTLIELEGKLKVSQNRLVEDISDISAEEMSKESQEAVDMLGDIHAALEMMDASSAESKARTVLSGLGFSAEKIDGPVSILSGGWRTRCDLACALCQYADLLLLDEPTNFLDLPSIIWLQGYIQQLEKTTVVAVTHDRDFADAVAEELLILRNLTIEKFRGNLSHFERERTKYIKWMTRMKDAQEKKTKHIEQTIEQNIRAAKRTGDDKKLKQATSRRKKLDERTGLEVGVKGGRFKLNRDLLGYHLTNRAEIEIPTWDPPIRIVFPSSPADLRFPGALVSLEKVSYTYDGGKKLPMVLNDIDLIIHPGERVGLTGLNGSGKTTLVSLIADGSDGQARILLPSKGTIQRHPRARFGRFSQQSVEELDSLAVSDSQMTALSHLIKHACGELAEKEARGILSGLGLQGPIASDVPVAKLSGGQKVRLALAKLVWLPPQLLILDEVTTHLDADTILGLALAVRSYEGAILVITHDRFFMRCVVEGESPYRMARSHDEDGDDSDGPDDGEGSADDENGPEPGRTGVVYRLVKGQLRKLDRGMEQYEEMAARATARLTRASTA